MINPVFLRTFLSLSQTKNFTATARALHMTQPGVSQHLQRLEEYFAMPLLTKERRTPELTEAGRKLSAYALRIFREHDAFLEEIKGDDPLAGACRIASPGSIGTKVYRILTRFAIKHPKLVIDYQFTPATSVLDKLRLDEVDVGVLSGSFDHTGFELRVVDEERLCIIVPRNFRGKSFESYRDLGFIAHPDGRGYLERLFRAMFGDDAEIASIPVRGHINSLMNIPDAVALGRGFTALPEFACQAYFDQKAIRYFVPKSMPSNDVYWVTRWGRQLPKRYETLMKAYTDKK